MPSLPQTPFKCPYYAVSCTLDPSTSKPYHECCVSTNGLAIFSQNYTLGLSYKTPQHNWTIPSVVQDIGPRFTIHGLWPNDCRGGFNQTRWLNETLGIPMPGTPNYDLHGCSQTRSFQNAAEVLHPSVAGAKFGWLLPLLKSIWRAGDGDDNWLWSHEWSKHGTCAESLKPECYEKYSPYQDFYEYMSAAVELYVKLDIMKAFHAFGVYASDEVGYTREMLNRAHEQMFGFPGGMQCVVGRDGKQYLSEVWTYLLEKPGHSYSVASPGLVTTKGGAYQSCKEDQLVFIPWTPSRASTTNELMKQSEADD